MAKRSNGEGTVYFNAKRQRWESQASFKDELGKSKRKLFVGQSQKEVNKKRKEWQKEIDSGFLPSASSAKTLLEVWINRWLQDFVKPSVKIKTYEKYNSSMKYVLLKFAETPIAKITTTEMQRFFNELLISGGQEETGVKSSTVRSARRHLIACFDKALAIGLIIKNVVRLTVPPRLTKEEIHPLNEIQIVTLLNVAKEGEYIYIDKKQHQKPSIDNQYLQALAYTSIVLAINTGMRLGEVFGLKWSDVDFQNKVINIQRSLSSTATQGLILEDPKTKGSRRRIPITANVTNVLTTYRENQKQFADLLGDVFQNTEDLAFCNSYGKPMSPSNFSRRFFKKITKKTGINNRFSFHDLRHTHATLLLQQGVNIKVISERLGHSSINITLDTYSHIMPSMQETAVQTLDNLSMY